MQTKAHSKLNLSLNVGAKNGAFHPIDSVVVSVDCCDLVEVVLRNDSTVTICGCDNIPTDKNTAYLAACAFNSCFGTCGCDVSIQKHIPMGAGMGGSSADAAAVVRCLCALHNVDIDNPQVHRLCADLGSDINFLLRGGLARICGKGDDVFPAKLGAPMYFAVTLFDSAMSTPVVYGRFDQFGGATTDNRTLLQLLEQGRLDEAAKHFCNGLQRAAMSLDCYAQAYLDFCSAHNLACCMTGSGSAYFVAAATAQRADEICTLLNAHGFRTFVCASDS